MTQTGTDLPFGLLKSSKVARTDATCNTPIEKIIARNRRTHKVFIKHPESFVGLQSRLVEKVGL